MACLLVDVGLMEPRLAEELRTEGVLVSAPHVPPPTKDELVGPDDVINQTRDRSCVRIVNPLHVLEEGRAPLATAIVGAQELKSLHHVVTLQALEDDQPTEEIHDARLLLIQAKGIPIDPRQLLLQLFRLGPRGIFRAPQCRLKAHLACHSCRPIRISHAWVFVERSHQVFTGLLQRSIVLVLGGVFVDGDVVGGGDGS